MAEKTKIIIIGRDETTRVILKDYVNEIEDAEVAAEFVECGHALEYAKQNECIIVIDISDDEQKSVEFISEINLQKKDAQIIAISNKTSTENIIKIMRAGAKEFITKPVTKTQFINTVTELSNYEKSNSGDNSCKIISTFSNKGGIGKTSIAVNLAVEIAEMTKEKTALIDLNLQLGDVSTFLDLTPSFDVCYVVNNLANIDKTNITNALTRYKNTSLYIAADPINIESSKEITAEQIKSLIVELKKTFSYIIIDVGTNIDAKTITVLDMSDLILLTAIVNLPAIRNIQRCMNLFKKLNYPPEKIKLVLNRYMENEEIKTSDIEDVVHQRVFWKIPNNYLTMMSAINKGVPVNVVNPEANISVNFREFASKVIDYLITKNITANKQNGYML